MLPLLFTSACNNGITASPEQSRHDWAWVAASGRSPFVAPVPCRARHWWLMKCQKARKIKQNDKTPDDLDRCPTRVVGRTRTMFHNTLLVGSSPTSSTTHS